jgi:hypothetical protein
MQCVEARDADKFPIAPRAVPSAKYLSPKYNNAEIKKSYFTSAISAFRHEIGIQTV